MRVMLNGPLVGAAPAGPGVHLRELVRAMLEERPLLDVVTRHVSLRRRDANHQSARRIDPRVRAVTTPVPARYLNRAQRLTRHPSERLLAGAFDVYHQLHTDTLPVVPGRRLVVTLHDTVALHWPDDEGPMAASAGRLLRRAAAVITVSQFSRDAICTAFGVSRDAVHVIPNGVDVPQLNSAPPAGYRPPVAGPYLLYVGGGTQRKNVPALLAAFARLTEDLAHKHLHLVLAGPVAGRQSSLRMTLEPRLNARVHFAGYVPDEHLGALYAQARLLVAPALYEGFGMPALEAMACGTPVVAANAGALPEVVGDVGVMVDPSDVLSIEAGMRRVLTESEASRRQRTDAGRQRCLGFSWGSAARRTLELYDEVASPRVGSVIGKSVGAEAASGMARG